MGTDPLHIHIPRHTQLPGHTHPLGRDLGQGICIAQKGPGTRDTNPWKGHRTYHPLNRMIDTCENITFPDFVDLVVNMWSRSHFTQDTHQVYHTSLGGGGSEYFFHWRFTLNLSPDQDRNFSRRTWKQFLDHHELELLMEWRTWESLI